MSIYSDLLLKFLLVRVTIFIDKACYEKSLGFIITKLLLCKDYLLLICMFFSINFIILNAYASLRWPDIVPPSKCIVFIIYFFFSVVVFVIFRPTKLLDLFGRSFSCCMNDGIAIFIFFYLFFVGAEGGHEKSFISKHKKPLLQNSKLDRAEEVT